MLSMSEIEEKIKSCKWVRIARQKAKLIILPGFEGVPLYDAIDLFVRGLFFGSLPQRASAIAFSFFLAIFPTILFFFTLIPFLGIKNLKEDVLSLISDTIPPSIYELIINLVKDIIERSQFGLLSFGFITAFIFATNGFQSIISAFNTSIHVKETRSFWQIQWISLVLLVLVSSIVIVAIGLIAFYEFFLNYFVDLGILNMNWVYYLIIVGHWIIQIALILFTFSFIIYSAPHNKGSKYRLFSAGSIFSTILFIISYLIFNYYALNFARYNALYGSIGTLILFMLWIYFNAFVLLIGFELNVAIKSGIVKSNIK